MSQLAERVVDAPNASEFIESMSNSLWRFKNPCLILISQSGETYDVIQAAKYAKEHGAKILALTNNTGSSIYRMADKAINIHAGPEIGVAATKTFSAQVATLGRLAIEIGKMNGALKAKEAESLIDDLYEVPKIVNEILENQSMIAQLAENLYNKPNIFYLARGISTATAREGALKLKEIAYIHAEAYNAGESKHGPLALSDAGLPVVFIVLPDGVYNSTVSNIEQWNARNAEIISVVQKGDKNLKELSKYSIEIPQTNSAFSPITYNAPLQLLAYYCSVKRGNDPDHPRHLAKSVTVK